MAPIVLVTGCSTGGLGHAMCNEFLVRGCRVIATSRNVTTIGAFENESNVKRFALDVTNDDQVSSVVQQVIEQEGGIDILVNNAGIILPGALIDHDIEAVKRAFDSNVFGIWRTAKAVIPEMAKRRRGLILNIGSVVGEIPTPWNGIYCASKAAVHSLSEVMSMECNPLGIKVMLVAPGSVRSKLSDNAAAHFSLPPDSLYKEYLPSIIARMYTSQSARSMPTAQFAKEVVSTALRRNPPSYKINSAIPIMDYVYQTCQEPFIAQPPICLDEMLLLDSVITIMSKYPDYLSPNPTPTKAGRVSKSRARREPSGVFSLFQAPQIQQFKEAFQLIDHDKDGWVSESDLKEIFASLGISPSRHMMDELLSARPGGHSRSSSLEDSSNDRGINFTMFLTMMGERLFEFDTEPELLEAFESFDEDDTGFVKVDEMRKWLSEVGERMGQREIDKFLKGPFTDRQGNFNYRDWVKVLRVNVDEEDKGVD